MAHIIHHEIPVKAAPEMVYEALLDAEQFSKLSGGAPTTIDRNEGGAFSCFGGYVTGRQLEMVPNKRIVQAWRAKGWPEGVHSIVRFELQQDGDGTEIIFDHIGFPEDQQEHLDKGWHDNYWNGLKTL